MGPLSTEVLGEPSARPARCPLIPRALFECRVPTLPRSDEVPIACVVPCHIRGHRLPGAAAACGLRATNGERHALALDRFVILYYHTNTALENAGCNCMWMRPTQARSAGECRNSSGTSSKATASGETRSRPPSPAITIQSNVGPVCFARGKARGIDQDLNWRGRTGHDYRRAHGVGGHRCDRRIAGRVGDEGLPSVSYA